MTVALICIWILCLALRGTICSAKGWVSLSNPVLALRQKHFWLFFFAFGAISFIFLRHALMMHVDALIVFQDSPILPSTAWMGHLFKEDSAILVTGDNHVDGLYLKKPDCFEVVELLNLRSF